MNPADLPLLITIPAGIVLGIVGVVLLNKYWAALADVVSKLTRRIENQTEKREAEWPADVLDYTGTVGFLLALAALGLVIFVPPESIHDPVRFWRSTAFLAFVAFALGLALALHERGIQEPTAGWLRGLLNRFKLAGRAWSAIVSMTKRGSPPIMQALGVAAMGVAVPAFIVAVVRFADAL